MRRLFLVLVSCFVLPLAAHADGGVLRRDGFLLIWEGINRSSESTNEVPFIDVPEGTSGFEEITYAKARGILDDSDQFHPDDSLTRSDALLWLLRTRNVADLDAMTRENLPALLDRYPIGTPDESAVVGDTQELLGFIRTLDTMLAEEVHEVSLYAEDFHGDGTAFGETFDMNALTAAHRTFPQNTLVKVTEVESGKSVTVRINDRGPYVNGRDMDLSLAAFEALAPRSQGVLHARFERLGDSEFIDQCEPKPRRYQRRITRNVRFHRGIPHELSVGESLYLGANRVFVVREIRYPDGSIERVQDFVWPDERFAFVPAEQGTYQLMIGTPEGRLRAFELSVHPCG